MTRWAWLVAALLGAFGPERAYAQASEAPRDGSPLLLLPVTGPESATKAFESELSEALRAALGRRAVVTLEEINVSLTAERSKDLLGCDDVACFAEILGALDGRWVISVSLMEAQPLSTVSVIVRDTHDAARSFRVERRAQSLSPARLQSLAADVTKGILGAAGWAPAEVERTASAGGGTLEVTSSPPGARVYLNYSELGRAPLSLSGLSPGDYVVTLEQTGFSAHEFKVQLGSGAVERLDVALDELRDFVGGASIGITDRQTFARTANDVAEARFTMMDVLAVYSRELVQRLEVGGFLGASMLTLQERGTTPSFEHNRWVPSVGLTASYGGYLGVLSLLEMVPPEASTDPALLSKRIEDANSDFSLIGGRLRASVVTRGVEAVTAELGLQLEMFSTIMLDVFWAPLLVADSGAFGDDAPRMSSTSRLGSMGVRFTLGLAGHYRPLE